MAHTVRKGRKRRKMLVKIEAAVTLRRLFQKRFPGRHFPGSRRARRWMRPRQTGYWGGSIYASPAPAV